MSVSNVSLETQNNSDASLWPGDLHPAPVETPVDILGQQAGFLEGETQNLLRGRLFTDEGGSENVIHSLFIEAPALNRYQYHLISVAHQASAPYPAHIVYDASENYDVTNLHRLTDTSLSAVFRNSDILDADQLKNRLKRTLTSDATRRLIESLMAQSKAVMTAGK